MKPKLKEIIKEDTLIPLGIAVFLLGISSSGAFWLSALSNDVRASDKRISLLESDLPLIKENVTKTREDVSYIRGKIEQKGN